MEITGLVWTRPNIGKMAAHQVTVQEVNSMVRRNDWVIQVRNRYPEQIRVIGPTDGDRLLVVVMEPTSDPGVWRPVTAWDASADERAYYRQEYR